MISMKKNIFVFRSKYKQNNLGVCVTLNFTQLLLTRSQICWLNISYIKIIIG